MKKKYIIIGSILLVYLILMILIFGFGIFKKELYIIVGENGKIKYEKGYKNIKKEESALYNWKWYDVYNDKGYAGKYKIRQYNGVWYTYNKNNEYIKVDSPIFAVKSNKKYSVPKYEFQNLNNDDLTELKTIMKDDEINDFSLLDAQKIVFDFDDDSEKESLYIVSNYYDDLTSNKKFSIVYYKDNNKISILEKDVKLRKESYDSYTYNLGHLIDIKDDKKIELIISKECFNNVCDDCYEMFKLKFGKYKKIKTCD